MPYNKSGARKEFEENILSLKLVAKKVNIKKNDISISKHVFQSCAFLLSAYLEEYIKVAVQNWIYMINHNQIPKKEIPVNLRTYMTIKMNESSYKEYLLKNSITKAVATLNVDNASLYKYINDESNHEVLHPYILNGLKYPSEDNIKKLFYILGIENIFTLLNKKGKKDFLLLLKAFSDVRTALAHQGSISLTYKDIIYHIRNINELVSFMDRILYSHILNSTGVITWKTL